VHADPNALQDDSDRFFCVNGLTLQTFPAL